MSDFPTNSPARLLNDWIRRQSAPEAVRWLEDRLREAAAGETKGLFMGFGLAGRRMGKADLELSESDLAQARGARPGWDPRGWSVDQAARTLLVLSLPAPDPAGLVATLDTLFAAAEMSEAIALYQSLPLLPFPESHRFRCTEGIRSNIKGVFCALAHRNPYPSEQLDEAAWNQLVLKALFVGASLDAIVGLDRRANPTLRQMLVDLAHERRAAHRPIPPELWRCVGPFADECALDDLELTLRTGSSTERQAAALSLSTCPHPRARSFLQMHPELQLAVADGTVSWSQIASQPPVPGP